MDREEMEQYAANLALPGLDEPPPSSGVTISEIVDRGNNGNRIPGPVGRAVTRALASSAGLLRLWL